MAYINKGDKVFLERKKLVLWGKLLEIKGLDL